MLPPARRDNDAFAVAQLLSLPSCLQLARHKLTRALRTQHHDARRASTCTHAPRAAAHILRLPPNHGASSVPCLLSRCIWYSIAIIPLRDSIEADALHPWLWHDESAYNAATLYVCSLYWALSVMTNLKGPPAHETRQCLWHEPEVSFIINPLGERLYTIFVFIVGCVLFSCICKSSRTRRLPTQPVSL